MSDLMFFGLVVGSAAAVVAVYGYIEVLKLRLERVKGEAYFNKQMWEITEKHLKEADDRILEGLK